MSKIRKILKRWKAGGKQSVPKEEVISVLNRYFPCNHKYKSGSHIVVWHKSLKGLGEFGEQGLFTVVIEGGQKVAYLYVKRLVNVIEYLYPEALDDTQEEDGANEEEP